MNDGMPFLMTKHSWKKKIYTLTHKNVSTSCINYNSFLNYFKLIMFKIIHLSFWILFTWTHHSILTFLLIFSPFFLKSHIQNWVNVHLSGFHLPKVEILSFLPFSSVPLNNNKKKKQNFSTIKKFWCSLKIFWSLIK